MAEYPCLYGPMVLMQLTFKVFPGLGRAVLGCAVQLGGKNVHFGRWLLPRGGYGVLYSVSDNKNQCCINSSVRSLAGWLGGCGNLDVVGRTVSSLDIYTCDVTDGGHCTALHQ